MKSYFLLLVLGAGGLLAPAPGRAQPAAPAPAATTDVLLLTNGEERRGRVLTIGPDELTYQPAPDSAQVLPMAQATAPSAAPSAARADTLRLPVGRVFLVRYANGTRELLAARTRPAPAADSAAAPARPATETGPVALRGLGAEQRRRLGQRDALRYYHHGGPFWGAFGSTLYLGPLFGLAPTAAISSHPVRPAHLQAPLALLPDPNYALGYQQQADRSKRGRTWAGYGAATGVYAVLIALVVGLVISYP